MNQLVIVHVRSGSSESQVLMKALNKMHWGETFAPEHPTEEHLESFYTLHRSHHASLILELQKSGDFKPIGFEMSGVQYVLVPKPR